MALSAELIDVTLYLQITSYWWSGVRLRASRLTWMLISGWTSPPVRPFCATTFSNDRSRIYWARMFRRTVWSCGCCGGAGCAVPLAGVSSVMVYPWMKRQPR